MTVGWKAALAVGVAVSCGGCTTYNPRPSARVAEVSEGYARDGRLIPHGFLDTGLVDAVRGNPEAESYARKYRGLQIGGLVLDLSAAGLVGGGLYETLSANGDPDMQSIGLGLLGGGFAVLAVGIILQAVGLTDKLDAINAYNDGAGVGPNPVPLSVPLLPRGVLVPRRDAAADALLR
jgi:hypothetical protein